MGVSEHHRGLIKDRETWWRRSINHRKWTVGRNTDATRAAREVSEGNEEPVPGKRREGEPCCVVAQSSVEPVSHNRDFCVKSRTSKE